jgi:carbamoyl-phosphate synthase large subunit
MALPGWKESVAQGRIPRRRDLEHVSVKEVVLPFPRFPGVDTTLGPEMKSTGEVMGVGADFPAAFAKASWGAGDRLPLEGTVFLSVADADKDAVILMALMFSTLGFKILATEGTHRALRLNGIDSELVLKHTVGLEMRAALEAGDDPESRAASAWSANAATQPIVTVVDLIEAGDVHLVINIPRGRGARADGYEIRRAALRERVPTMTNAAAAHAAVQAIASARRSREVAVSCLQDLHYHLSASSEAAGVREKSADSRVNDHGPRWGTHP